MPSCTHQEWEDFYQQIPEAHLLQSPAWGELKADFGWTAQRLRSGEIGAQVLFQEFPLGIKVAYIPKGPICQEGNPFLLPDWPAFQGELDQLCREQNAVFLKVEPDLGYELAESAPAGYRLGFQSIQPPRSLLIDLQGSEDEILERMKSKTRYNIRLAGRKGVRVRKIATIEPFYDLLESTSGRAAFGIHSREYYQRTWDLFSTDEICALFLAEFEGQPLASIMVFKAGNRSWYLYGASSNQHREKMATYLVQWEAMRWAREQGCSSYDLWGVPDFEEQVLEEQFSTRRDGLWGVYRFKRGFGGALIRSAGPWDRVYRPLIYNLYQLWIKINSR